MKNRLQIKSKRNDKLRNDHQNKAKSRKTKTQTNKTQNYQAGKLMKQHQNSKQTKEITPTTKQANTQTTKSKPKQLTQKDMLADTKPNRVQAKRSIGLTNQSKNGQRKWRDK